MRPRPKRTPAPRPDDRRARRDLAVAASVDEGRVELPRPPLGARVRVLDGREREDGVAPADDAVDEVVLTGVDERERHRQRIEDEQGPPPARNELPDVQAEEQGER